MKLITIQQLKRFLRWRNIAIQNFSADRSFHSDVRKNGVFNFVKRATCVDNSNGNQNTFSLTELKQILQQCDTVSKQVTAFGAYSFLTEEDFESRQSVCLYLETLFRPHFPSCSVCSVGSTITGFGLRGCDLDLSFQLSKEDISQHVISDGHRPPVILTRDLEKGEVPVSMFPFLTSKQKLHFLKKILSDSGVHESAVIPGRCSILNFIYKNLKCDLAIENKSAMQGSHFMLLCNKLDSRVQPLCSIITYWAKHSKFCGGPSKFKSYGIFLLVVYFLQTRYPPILPPVEYIFGKTDFLKNLDNRSYDATKYIDRIEPSQNSQSIEELLQEFFLFYTNFDFSHVICPFTCSSVESSSFSVKDSVTDEPFVINAISIQDPLNLSWNVTTGVSWKYCRLFIKYLLSASEVCTGKTYWSSSSENWGLSSLLDSHLLSHSIANQKHVIIETPFTNVNDERDSMTMAEKVFYLLSRCLLFECRPVSLSTDIHLLDKLKSKRTMSFKESEKLSKSCRSNVLEEKTDSNIEESGSLVSRFSCITQDTWKGRSQFQSLFHGKMAKEVLAIEQEVSRGLFEISKVRDKDNFHFICECWRIDANQSHKLILVLKPVNSDVFVPKLGVFLKEFISKYMKQCYFNDINDAC